MQEYSSRLLAGTHILVPVGRYDVPVRRPEALDLPRVDLVLVQVGHVLGNVELRDGDVVQVLPESHRVRGKQLHAAREVGEAAVQVVKVEVAGLLVDCPKFVYNALFSCIAVSDLTAGSLTMVLRSF